MTSGHDDLARLMRLRGLFLDDDKRTAPIADYWRDDDDLAAYDEVLAERIGWKWDAVLDECAERGWPANRDAVILDWGCGSGVAARRFVERFGAREVVLHDRSERAMRFAARRLGETAPEVQVRIARRLDGEAPDVLLVSHVLGEIDARGEIELRATIARSRAVLIVEPGTHAVARRLAALRDECRDRFRIVAPCTHAERCPSLATPNDWCHFFAPPPSTVFTDGEWVRVARELGIDLRALPYSFLALLDRALRCASPHHDAGRSRVLGRPSIGRRNARVHVCDAAGLRLEGIEKDDSPELFRMLDKRPHRVRLLPHAGPQPEL